MTLEAVPAPGGVRLLRVHGELDVVAADALTRDVARLTGGTGPLVLDLSLVTFFDSAGVRFVDRLARECDRTGWPFRVVAPNGTRARRVLDVVGLSAGLATHDVDAAVEQVRGAD